AITKGGKGIGHLVLVVTSTNGDYVLDLGTDDIQPWKKLDYKWISRKKPGKNIMWSRLDS
ncbi:MAG: transglutaminase-like cysteine peptidase, partial [Rhodospirillaceae bacterium]|nr:transglutaminase-like cysteine peptidase [Rhodospirillaceae bacterium]